MAITGDDSNQGQGDVLSFSKRKLREATFFLDSLERESALVSAEHDEPFVFYLSAFLGAARSVTFALQKEAKTVYDAAFPDWYESQTETDRNLFDFMKGQRNRELKGSAESDTGSRLGAQTQAGKKEILIDDVYEDASGRYEVVSPTLALNMIEEAPARVRKPALFFEIEEEKLEVVEACKRYCELLTGVLQSVEARVAAG